jgi:poly-beta-1,6-N-acetyl-D-glucosamine synthase
MMITWMFTFLIFGYCLFIVYLWLGWERIPQDLHEDFRPHVAVIIPIRNEGENIEKLLNDLKFQSYEGHLEIIVVDDQSVDDSLNIVKEISRNFQQCKFLSLTNMGGKKAAIAKGIKNTEAEIILTTDGDCRVPATWVESMIKYFSSRTKMVGGPVKFIGEAGFFKSLQSLEFTSLIGSGASFIGWHKPVMVNGANLAFKKQAFIEVGGFDGNQNTASGDDVFLLHKIIGKYEKSVVFAKSNTSIVTTKSASSFYSFIQQRIRWASKWKAYTDMNSKLTAVLLFIVSLSLVAMPVLVVLNTMDLFYWLNLLVIKSFFDYFFIRHVSTFLEEKLNLFVFIVLYFFYPLYIVLTALLSFQNSYHWKGRKVK